MQFKRYQLLLAMALGAGTAAQASSWIPIYDTFGNSRIMLAKPGLDGVSGEPFQYGDTANITLNGFGVTDTVYFQTQTWSNGSYDTGAAWQCHDKATLSANNQQLIIPMDASGRYKVNVAVAMGRPDCDIPTFTAGGLSQSTSYLSDEFVQIKHTTLNSAQGFTSIFRQNQSSDGNGNLTNYGIQMKWPEVEGIDNYVVTLNKNHLPYTLPVISKADYQADIADTGYYQHNDFYNSNTQKFAEQTGPGTYDYEVSYCFDNQCSAPIADTTRFTVRHKLAESFYIDDPNDYPCSQYSSDTCVAEGTIKLTWVADSRTPRFGVKEDLAGNAGQPAELSVVLPNADTKAFVIGSTTQYTHTLPVTKEGLYYYYLKTCGTDCTPTPEGLRRSAQLGLNESLPTGGLDPFIYGSDRMTGVAYDDDRNADPGQRRRKRPDRHLPARQRAAGQPDGHPGQRHQPHSRHFDPPRVCRR